MAEQQKKQKNTVVAFIIVVAVIVAVTILAVAKKFSRTAEQPGPQRFHTYEQEHKSATADSPAESASEETVTLEDIVKARSYWGPIFTSWHGKPAPDFTVKDIEAKVHKLSDYRGKNVMIVFWTTWCPACNMEIPHLIGLRKEFSEDKLAILAISNESPGTLKRFVAAKKINYTVALLGGPGLAAPFGVVKNIPAIFFIDAKGNIKFALEGLATLAEVKAILQAPLEASRP